MSVMLDSISKYKGGGAKLILNFEILDFGKNVGFIEERKLLTELPLTTD